MRVERRVKLAAMIALLGFSVFVNVWFLISSAYAQTWVEGHITTDTTWTLENSPYRVINDVTVDSGVLLTIEPGVEVQFADGFSLIVEGSLRSVGTESDEICFTSSRVSPSPGVWNRIEFKGNQSESLVMEHSIIELAETGIWHSQQGPIEISASEISNNKNGVILGIGNTVLKENTFESCEIAIKTTHVNIYNVTIQSNKIQGNHWGILCDSVGGELRNFTIQNNELVSNTGGGILIEDVVYFGTVVIKGNYLHSNGDNAIRLSNWYNWYQFGYDGNLSVRDNQITSNEGWAISVYMRGQMQAEIVNNAISQNEGGVALHYEPRDPDSSSFNISNNLIESNTGHGVNVLTSGYNANLAYEAEIYNNSILSNSIGVYIAKSSHPIHITYNSIVNNSKGIEINSGSGGHVAEYNHIMENVQGIYVSYRAAMKAEDNYWGHASGPYHESLNPEGQGNSVNGDGTDLDFIPFSPSPFWSIPESLVVSVSLTPVAVSSGGEISISVHVTNETVAVNDAFVQLSSDNEGSFSPSSGNTYSNGDFDAAFTAPSVTSQTTVKITATASKTGYNPGSDHEYVTVYPLDTLFLSVTITADPSQVQSSGTSTITVRVTDGTNAVSDASVSLSSNNGGSLSPTSGITDVNGHFTSTYTAPSVTTETTITISADATKTGYLDGQGQTQIAVTLVPPPEEDSPLWIYLAILIIIVFIIGGGITIARRKRHKPKEETISRPLSST